MLTTQGVGELRLFSAGASDAPPVQLKIVENILEPARASP